MNYRNSEIFMNEQVYLLWHTHATEAVDNHKLIGVYTSEQLAEGAKARIVKQPGFQECPDGFLIVPAVLNKDSWEEGYFTVTD